MRKINGRTVPFETGLLVWFVIVGTSSLVSATEPVRLEKGPQLFLDDYMIAHAADLKRVFHSPERLQKPVLDFPTFHTMAHHTSVIYDPTIKRYRFWYTDSTNKVAHTESKDGIHWEKPTFIDMGGVAPTTFSVFDDQENATEPNSRFKMVCQVLPKDSSSGKRGMGVFVSPDGFRWTPYEKNPVVPRIGKDPHLTIGDNVGGLFYDPMRQRYMATFMMPAQPDDGFQGGPLTGSPHGRRLVGMSTSKDFYNWSEPRRICVPDLYDDGLTEFYGMKGIHARGSLLIGFVPVLRDDLPYEEGAPVKGIGYTVLAISRDGENWRRFREPFLDRNPISGTWDRAMTWITTMLPMGNEMYLYYGGYAEGHKPDARTGGRQVGMAKLRKDGYASLRANKGGGTLVTPYFTFEGDRLEMNVDVWGGAEARVELQDETGKAIKGFALEDCDRIYGDRIAYNVTWNGKSDVSSLAGEPIRLHVRMRSADLYTFQFVSSAENNLAND